MFDHMDGIGWALAKKRTQQNEDMYYAIKLALQKPSKYYAEVTPTNGMDFILAPILDPFRKFRSFWSGNKGMDVYPGDETSSTTYHQ